MVARCKSNSVLSPGFDFVLELSDADILDISGRLVSEHEYSEEDPDIVIAAMTLQAFVVLRQMLAAVQR